MFQRFHYTFQKARGIIKKITAAIEVPNTSGLRLLLIFLEWRNLYEKESLS